MQAAYVAIHPKNPENRKIEEVVQCVKSGGVVIYPTDTVYALGCSLFQKQAIQKLCTLKERKPEKMHLAIICKDISQMSQFVRNLDTPTFKLIKSLLPGPYAIILEASNEIPKLMDVKKKQVAVRIPNHPIPVALVEALGHPLVTTSIKNDDAILQYTTEPEEIYHDYKHLVDIFIDGGTGNNTPSTVIDCTSWPPVLIRKGLGAWNEL